MNIRTDNLPFIISLSGEIPTLAGSGVRAGQKYSTTRSHSAEFCSTRALLVCKMTFFFADSEMKKTLYLPTKSQSARCKNTDFCIKKSTSRAERKKKAWQTRQA